MGICVTGRMERKREKILQLINCIFTSFVQIKGGGEW